MSRTRLGLGRGGARFPQKATCLDIYSRCVNAQLPLNEVLPTAFPWCLPAEEGLAQLFAAYMDAKEEQQVLDYDDLLLFWHGLLADPAGGARVRQRFDHVLVDEYQDTNALQADIVGLLRPDGTGITCVGDDAQAIYGFRAATVRNILDFEQRFPGARRRDAHAELPLHGADPRRHQRAHRRGRRAARQGALDGPGRRRPPGPRHLPRRGRADGVALRAHPRRTASRGRSSRSRRCSSAPSTTPWRSRWSSPAATSPSTSTAGCASSRRRTSRTSWPSCGSPRTPRTPWPACACSGWCRASDPRRRRRCSRAWAPPPATSGGVGRRPRPRAGARRLAGRRRALRHARRRRPLGRPGAGPRACAASTGRCSSAATTTCRRACATSSRSRGSRPARRPRSQFLAELVLDPPAYTQELAGPPLLDEDYLVLSTMHSAKGLEFDVVYVIHAADGNIPSDMATGSAAEDRGGAAALLRRLHARPRAALRQPPAALLHAAVGQGRHAWVRAALALPHQRGRHPLRRGSDGTREVRDRRGSARSRHHRLHPRRRALALGGAGHGLSRSPVEAAGRDRSGVFCPAGESVADNP